MKGPANNCGWAITITMSLMLFLFIFIFEAQQSKACHTQHALAKARVALLGFKSRKNLREMHN